jgi:hypothetical protein
MRDIPSIRARSGPVGSTDSEVLEAAFSNAWSELEARYSTAGEVRDAARSRLARIIVTLSKVHYSIEEVDELKGRATFGKPD